MKRTYTVLFLSITILSFAQRKKIEETSEKGFYFKQVGDKIEVWRGYPSSDKASNNSDYSFIEEKKSERMEVVSNNKSNRLPASAFSSPNEVKITQDAEGNKYWIIIDGTVVKTELATKANSEKATPQTTSKIITKDPKKNSDEIQNNMISTTSEKKLGTSGIVKVASKKSSIKEEIPVKGHKNVAQVNTNTKSLKLSEQSTEVKNANVEVLDSKSLKEVKTSETVTASSLKSETPKEPIPPQGPVFSNEKKEIQSVKVKEETPVKTNSNLAPTNTITEKPTLTIEPSETKHLNIKELDSPTGKEVKTDINNNEDINEEIKIDSGDVGNVSDLFEKNYDNMTNKEKKLYRKNEKKIMKQLKAELKLKEEESN